MNSIVDSEVMRKQSYYSNHHTLCQAILASFQGSSDVLNLMGLAYYDRLSNIHHLAHFQYLQVVMGLGYMDAVTNTGEMNFQNLELLTQFFVIMNKIHQLNIPAVSGCRCSKIIEI